jgi:predicted nucleic acid-binding protein
VAARIGFDTGFFVLLANGRREAMDLWREVSKGEREAVVSAVTLYEIDRLGLRGELEAIFVDTALESIPEACRLVWVDELSLIRSAARLAQGHALSQADALILASLLDQGCTEIYTTDRDLARYRKEGVEVVNLRA